MLAIDSGGVRGIFGCLLVLRRLLHTAVRKGMTGAGIASTHNLSETTANFRLRTTGVLRKLGAVG